MDEVLVLFGFHPLYGFHRVYEDGARVVFFLCAVAIVVIGVYVI